MDVCSAKSPVVDPIVVFDAILYMIPENETSLVDYKRSEDMQAWTRLLAEVELFCGLPLASPSPHLSVAPLGLQSSTSLYSSQRSTSRHGDHAGSHFTACSSQQRRQLATSSTLAAALPCPIARRLGRPADSCTITASPTSTPFRLPFSLAHSFPPVCAAANSDALGGVASLGPFSFYLEVLPSTSGVGIGHGSAVGEVQVGSQVES